MVPILVILTIATCLLVDFAVQARRARVRATVATALTPPLMGELAPERSGFSVPGGVFIHRGHTWAHLQASGDARVGLDDFAQKVIGKVDRIELPSPGTRVKQGERAFAVVQGNRHIDFVSPLDGTVASVNDSAGSAVATSDPYRVGWLFAIKPENLVSNLRKLRIAGDAVTWIEKEAKRLVDFVTLHSVRPLGVGVTVPDGGQCIPGIAEALGDEQLQLLTKSFFK